jgi:Asp-tRNA(Asn)/Glu-tRNA(Gln) amidotransferase A subunit family amidase
MTNLRNSFRTTYAAHWLASGVDVVLCPAGPHTAPKLGETLGWSGTNVW